MHELGAQFDAWGEHLKYEAWCDAFRECGMDLEKRATAEWHVEAPVPWEHIDCGWVIQRALTLETRTRAL